jgi:hypothetical protein
MSSDRVPDQNRNLPGYGRQAAATRGRPKLVFALLALLLVIVSGMAWLFGADHTYLRDDVERWLSNSLGREVRINGPMHLTLGSAIHLSVNGLVVASEDWTKEPDLLQIDELTASLSLTSLFSPETLIESLSLSGLKIYLEVDADHGNNWTLGRAEDAASAPQDRTRRTRIPFRIEHFELAKSKLEYRSPGLTEVLQFSITRLTESILASRQVEIELHGDVNGTPVALAVRINDIERLSALQDVRFSTEGSLGEIKLSGKLEFEDLLQPSRPLADISLDGPDIAYLADILRIESVTSGPLAMKFKIEPADDNMSVDLMRRAFSTHSEKSTLSRVRISKTPASSAGETRTLEVTLDSPRIRRNGSTSSNGPLLCKWCPVRSSIVRGAKGPGSRPEFMKAVESTRGC